MTPEQKRAFNTLTMCGVFFDVEDDEDTPLAPKWGQTLNLNDTFSYACADGEFVSDDQMVRVEDLYSRYGLCGIYYWVSEQRGQCKSEFAGINRMIDFVREEEKIRSAHGSLNAAFTVRSYTIGDK